MENLKKEFDQIAFHPNNGYLKFKRTHIKLFFPCIDFFLLLFAFPFFQITKHALSKEVGCHSKSVLIVLHLRLIKAFVRTAVKYSSSVGAGGKSKYDLR